MAEDASNAVGWLSLPADGVEGLAGLRPWPHLKLATDAETVWVRGFAPEELELPAVVRIPFSTRYLERDGRLFRQGHRVPFRHAPALLWTPLARALPLSLPPENHNYFGVRETVRLVLTPTDAVQEAVALRCSRAALEAYVDTASAARFQGLSWVLLGDAEALVFGTPLLPLPGTAYWQRDVFLLPAGSDAAIPFLLPFLKTTLNLKPGDRVLWDAGAGCAPIAEALFRPLSRSAVRLSRALAGRRTS